MHEEESEELLLYDLKGLYTGFRVLSRGVVSGLWDYAQILGFLGRWDFRVLEFRD